MANDRDSKKYAKLTAGYQESSSQIFDELWNGDGSIRRHWKDFMRAQRRLGPDEIESRKSELERVLRENGVTYNVYSDGKSHNRPWDIDPCPLIIGGNEWATLEPALAQRAKLMNAMYCDIYGEQRLLSERIVPAELVYQHPGFCRAAINLPSHVAQITQCAFNLVRGTDNRWWVLSDRIQAVHGSGYALETRLAMSRVYPNLLRHCDVQRLAGYFSAAYGNLMDMADSNDPNIVLLSPGPRNESYFEDAYLANYQGYTLVQGDDLVVRDGYVWLKTIRGLKKVNVILRRVSDQFSDPLELRSDSFIGVPGLLEAMRQQKVVVVNPIGAWLLESPGFYPFFEQICQFLLGEPLKMPNAASWWCGHPDSLPYVIENISTMVVKSISDRRTIAFGHLLDEPQKQKLILKLQANPGLYVGQQMLHVSTMPGWVDQSLRPRHGFLRTFITATSTGYQLMPGGLACVARDDGQSIVSTQTGAINKDTWVRASEQMPLIPFVSNISAEISSEPQLREISSRTAENLFWVGRYSQRAELVARMMRQVINSYFEGLGESGEVSSTAMRFFDALKHYCNYHPPKQELAADSVPEPEQHSLTDDVFRIAVDSSVERGLANILDSFHRSAFHSRDVWSTDSWRVVDDINAVLPSLRQDQGLVSLIRALDKLLTSLMALNGLIADSMTQDDGWHMLSIGQLVERTLNISHVIKHTIIDKEKENEYEILSALLSSNDNVMNFRRYYRANINIVAVLDYLLLNKFNARGLGHQLERLQGHVKKIVNQTQMSAAEKSVLSAYTQIQLADVIELAKAGDNRQRDALDKLIDQVRKALEKTSIELGNHFFIHTQKSRSNLWVGRK